MCIKSHSHHQVALSVTHSSCSQTRVSTRTCKRSPPAILSTMITMRSTSEKWQWLRMMITTRSSWLAAWWFLWLHHPLWLHQGQETFSFPSNPGSGQRHQQQGGDGRGKAVAGLHHKAGHEINLVLMFLFLQGKTSSMNLESPGCTSCRFWFDLSSFVHFLQECLFPFGVAYALQKDSPYTQRLLIYEKEDMYRYIFTYMYCFLIFYSRLCYEHAEHSSIHIIWRFSSKIQQLKESGLINLWIRQEQDLVGQRAEEGLNVIFSHCDLYIKILLLKGSSRGGISPLSLDNMQPVFVVGFINSQIHLKQHHLI